MREWRSDREVALGWVVPKTVPPELGEQLPRLISERKTALQPASKLDIAGIISRLALHYPSRERSDAELRMVAADLIDDLAEFPAIVIFEVANEWRRTEKWFPRSSELREMCSNLRFKQMEELIRLQFLQWCVDKFNGHCPRIKHPFGREGEYSCSLTAIMAGKQHVGSSTVILPGDPDY